MIVTSFGISTFWDFNFKLRDFVGELECREIMEGTMRTQTLAIEYITEC